MRFIPAGAGNTHEVESRLRPRPVHPRGRGEHGDGGGVHAADDGSSPRARGTLRGRRTSLPQGRFIPAGAGNTRGLCGGKREKSVHPRGRGEHQGPSANPDPKDGSSPRARGTPPAAVVHRVRIRFIPAGAGNTRSSASHPPLSTVHPRGRGEHRSAIIRFTTESGSSPRARGTRSHVERTRQSRRFIPAGAGNTRHRKARPRTAAVHPRGRGEHVGSRMSSSATARFIPAGAGNTQPEAAVRSSLPVHPRGRGEHGRQSDSDRNTGGSSPRARGTRRQTRRRRTTQRFIPAGAGNTPTAPSSGGLFSVHPRGRGEHSAAQRRARYAAGSSPRARGTRLAA